jgi:hypothetical protein
MSCGISSSFPEVFPTSGQVTHVLLTRPPLDSGGCPPGLARLACVKHAASVHSEPGSNSPLKGVQTAPLSADRFELNPVSLRKQFLVLRENQRKIDVWHALLSFQGTAPPGVAAPKPRRTAGAKPKEHPSCDGPSSLANILGLVNERETPPSLVETRRLTPEEALGKNQPLRGTGI